MNDKSQAIEVGQVWQHPNTMCEYRIVGFPYLGGVTIVRADSMRSRHIWIDYLRANFRLVPALGVSSPHAANTDTTNPAE